MFTLVGSGHKTVSQSSLPMGKSIPKGAKWIKDSVTDVEPENKMVATAEGLKVRITD